MNKLFGYIKLPITKNEDEIISNIKRLISLGVKKENIFIEKTSVRRSTQAELNSLLEKVQEGDTIICLDIHQVAGSMKQFCRFIETVETKKIKLIINDLVIDCSGVLEAETVGMLKMVRAFEQIEHNVISQRVKMGVANARENGKAIGRPSLRLEDIPKKVIDNYKLLEEGTINKTDYAKLCNISRPTLNKYLEVMKKS